jgi:hypothetical protein
MSNEQKMVSISTIPLSKLSVIMNNFVANTITHLNKLSVKGDEKLAEFDKKLNDLDVMTTLLEAKLNSLPEKITSTYPPLNEVNLDDIIPVIIQNPPQPVEQPPEPPVPTIPDNGKDSKGKQEEGETLPTNGEEIVHEEEENLTPQQELDKFLDEHENLKSTYKLLKMGIPTMQVEQKARMNGANLDEITELFELAKKVDPNIK